ncbi:hypothetical protein CA14_011288 [Aspergillus flavus]|uniref:Uncharacterized protein n=1 Tax=Aspergillus flavus TaxID=5059 RepID=A0AB74CA00_ASPFL|nr:hypothetical protein CA14_011288 [Aspergillus flavus]
MTAIAIAHFLVTLKTRAPSCPTIIVQGRLDMDDDLASSVVKYTASIRDGESQGDFGFNEDLGSALTKYAALVLGTRNDHVTGYELLYDVIVDG